jgi:hypothetical protein
MKEEDRRQETVDRIKRMERWSNEVMEYWVQTITPVLQCSITPRSEERWTTDNGPRAAVNGEQ